MVFHAKLQWYFFSEMPLMSILRPEACVMFRGELTVQVNLYMLYNRLSVHFCVKISSSNLTSI